MARLTRKADLLARFEEAVRLSGYSLLYLSSTGEYPAIYRVYRDRWSKTVRVYIWNISHGGGSKRSATEYRIQITGVDHFYVSTQDQTLILGWWEDVGAFAGWDVRQHLGSLGSSPSMQVGEGALRSALLTGFAPYVKSNGETAIAFRPDFIGTYIEHIQDLHDSGSIPAEAAILATLAADPEDVDNDEINKIPAKRKYAITETKRALRALDFTRRVLTAYGHSCAMCGVQLRLVDGAHILPVAHVDSTDQTANGVALCALHHRSYDRGLVTFDADYSIIINKSRFQELIDSDRGKGGKAFRSSLRPVLAVPPDKKDRPAAKFVEKANMLRGW